MISGLSRETMQTLDRQWNPVNTVTNGTKKLDVFTSVFYKIMYGRLAGWPKKVAVITR